MIRFGGPVFIDSIDPEALAAAHVTAGYRAAYCPESLTGRDENLISKTREAFSQADIMLAEVGAWCNPMSLDQDLARRNIAYVQERLALAEALGAGCCVNVVGTQSTDNWYAPHASGYTEDFFAQAVDVAREIIDAVNPVRTRMSFEVMPYMFLDGPEAYLRFLTAIDRPGAGVHFDPANCIYSPRLYYHNSDMIRQMFALLGDRIVSCHLKDIRLMAEPPTVMFEEVRIGLGALDYRVLLTELNALQRDIPAMLEHLPNENEYILASHAVRQIAAQNKITL